MAVSRPLGHKTVQSISALDKDGVPYLTQPHPVNQFPSSEMVNLRCVKVRHLFSARMEEMLMIAKKKRDSST